MVDDSHKLMRVQNVHQLECEKAFEKLTPAEKTYAYHLQEAAWAGSLIITIQTSCESPVIMSLIHDIFKTNSIGGLQKLATEECGFTKDEWDGFVLYAMGVLVFKGNYNALDKKFIPDVPLRKLEALFRKANFTVGSKVALERFGEVKGKMYSLKQHEKFLGFGSKGSTTYFSSNCTEEDLEIVTEFMNRINLEGWMTRCFKTVRKNGKISYEIRTASAETDKVHPKPHEFKGREFVLTKGGYSPILTTVIKHLKNAEAAALNSIQKRMISQYIKAFQEGSLEAHKAASVTWLLDKNTPVETYTGFIETYRDPAGSRGEWESFVGVVDQMLSSKFTKLLQEAEQILKLLPWGKEFEVDPESFQKAGFVCFDIITYASSGIPAGINIPNYSEIRAKYGFKNCAIANVHVVETVDSMITYFTDEDNIIYRKYRRTAFDIQTGFHEVFGHGAGKLFMNDEHKKPENYSPKLNNPFTNQPVTAYEKGETFETKFGHIAGAYEECRAELVGLFLCLEYEIMGLFGLDKTEAEDVAYVQWLAICWEAVMALIAYSPGKKMWLEPHDEGEFVILQLLIQDGDGVVKVEETPGRDGKPGLTIRLDRSKIKWAKENVIGPFLHRLQVFKSTGDVHRGKLLFEKYSKVSDEWAARRQIIISRRRPSYLFTQPNLHQNDDGTIELRQYEGSPAGLIQSWIERFQPPEFYNDLFDLHDKNKKYFD